MCEKFKSQVINFQLIVIFKFCKSFSIGYKNLLPQEREGQRDQNIKPLLVDLKALVEEQSVYVAPLSPIGKAMSYMQTQ